jgi:hypothetical protein
MADIRKELPDDNDVPTGMRSLAKSIGREMNTWADEE